MLRLRPLNFLDFGDFNSHPYPSNIFSCYWLDQFLTLALDAWILSKFSTLYWICLLLVFLILVGVELPLCL